MYEKIKFASTLTLTCINDIEYYPFPRIPLFTFPSFIPNKPLSTSRISFLLPLSLSHCHVTILLQ